MRSLSVTVDRLAVVEITAPARADISLREKIIGFCSTFLVRCLGKWLIAIVDASLGKLGYGQLIAISQ